MNKDRKILYSTSLILLAVLLFILFWETKRNEIITAILLAIATPAVFLIIRKRSSLSINKREVLLLSAIISVLFVILIHMSGLFFGFRKNPYFMKPNVLLTIALPVAVIIITTEIIRYVFLSQKNKFVSFIAFITCVVAEILTVSTLPGITSFNKFMDLVGLTLFPTIIANVYYHYSSKRFGIFPNIVFRLITTLYVYFLPTLNKMPDALFSCIKIFLPIIMLALVSALYEKKKKNALNKTKKLSVIATAFAAVVILSVAMLVSCQFRFGAIVIATESMTGEINKGDMILYERYEGQAIEEGQVIVFLDNKNRIVHRVVEIERIGNEVRYYTKGDANDDLDAGYITNQDIVGLTDLKIAYVGYPTLWLRQLLKAVK